MYYPSYPSFGTPMPYNGQSVTAPLQNEMPYRAQVPALPGRVVNSAEEIMASEVPMDGSVSVFMQRDMSCLYSKQWCSDGTIKTVKYVPVVESPAESKIDFETAINKRFDKLERLIANQKHGYKKEAIANDQSND